MGRNCLKVSIAVLGAVSISLFAACDGDGASQDKATCDDGKRNGEETGVDCGGPDCAPCAAGESCSEPSDCQSGICLEETCQAPTCDDGVQNGQETAVDCGGPDCAPCAAGESCSEPSDCQSGVCLEETCQAPTCNDGVQNGQETGVDCGGPDCAPC